MVLEAHESTSRLAASLAAVEREVALCGGGGDGTEQTGESVALDVAGGEDDARRGMKAYNTTQIFMMPVGDWTQALSRAVKGRRERRACWVRGPFVSPYSVAKDFSQLLLFASGIGITPALGVMGHYHGGTRVKFLVWSTRSLPMLKFFAPLLKDAHLCLVYYTGTPKLTSDELASITSHGHILVQQVRPDFVAITESIMREYEKSAAGIGEAGELDLRTLDSEKRAAWCALYCGGSQAIKGQLSGCAKRLGIGFHAELFDW